MSRALAFALSLLACLVACDRPDFTVGGPCSLNSDCA